MNLILCGMPMSGKTTVGKLVAEKLHWTFIDSDWQVERAYGRGRCCREIVLQEGEPFFRQLEREQIVALHHVKRCVIALGGGSLSHPETLQLTGCFIYLKTEVAILWQRMQNGEVPAHLDSENPQKALETLAQERHSLYETVAHRIIETVALSSEEIAEMIIDN